MPINMLDLVTGEWFGPYDDVNEARSRARSSNIRAYTLWENGEKIEQVGRAPAIDQSQEHAT